MFQQHTTTGLKHRWDTLLLEHYTGYFALIMATGIVSIACHLMQMSGLSLVLFDINRIAYGILWFLFGYRLIRHTSRVKQDFTNHARGATFFTMVAGTSVLGSQFVILHHNFDIAIILWGLAIFLWTLLVYGFFALTIGQESKPSLEHGINGSWLITVVATQSIVVLGSLLASHLPDGKIEILFFSLMMFLIGCMFYIVIMAVLFYRFLFFRITPESLTPPYWITMGAVAITTLAGSRLMLNAETWPFIQELMPFLKGFTLFFWSAGTWLIPLIIVLGLWRHVYRRFPIRYDPQYWSMVFPLGMYTVATFYLAKLCPPITFLSTLPNIFIHLALLAWLVTFASMIRHGVGAMVYVLTGWERHACKKLSEPTS